VYHQLGAAGRWCAAASALLLLSGGSPGQGIAKMKTVVHQLAAEMSVTPRVHTNEELRIEVVLTNESSAPMRVNTLYLNIGQVILKFRDAKGAPVPTGPPPMPPLDDGRAGRISVAPGKSLTFVYQGSQVLGSDLKPGSYEVLFRYANENATPGEWAGVLEAGPLSFTVG
jgi:hypothetical protein